MLNLTSGGNESGALPIFERQSLVVEKERTHCLAAVAEGPDANILTPISCSEAKVIVVNKRLEIGGGVGVAIVNCQLHVRLQKSKCTSA